MKSRLGLESLSERVVPSAIVGDFGSSGLYRWTSDAGSQISTSNPEGPGGLAVANDGDTVVAGFGSAGLSRWTNAGGWKQITTADPEYI